MFKEFWITTLKKKCLQMTYIMMKLLACSLWTSTHRQGFTKAIKNQLFTRPYLW